MGGLLLVSSLHAAWPMGRAAASEPTETRTGAAASGLPGTDRVGFALPMRRPASAGMGLSYGYTEEVLGTGDLHHRIGARAAAAYSPLPMLGLALRIDGRYDAHRADTSQSDSGFVGETRFTARALHALNDLVSGGAEITLHLPGADTPRLGISAASLQAKLLATLSSARHQTSVSANVGFHLDRSAHGVEDDERLSLADRVGLGASDSSALLLGIGVQKRFDRFDLLFETSWDLLVGSSAPSPGQSPIRFVSGARYWLHDALHLELLVGVSPSGRPTISDTGPLYPIEPRAWASAAFALYFPRAPSGESTRPEPDDSAPPGVGTVAGRLLDLEGAAVPDALVRIGAARATSDEAGRFELTDLAPGPAELTVEADGFQPARQQLGVEADTRRSVELVLRPALPAGQIRGTVRSIGGTPLKARVSIAPLDLRLTTAADGTFAVDVAPGKYEVTVHAAGHREQKRNALVEENGVTVLLVDLEKQR